MSGVRRAIWLTIAALFVAVGVLWPLPFSGLSQAGPADDPVTISDFQADFRIDAAGNLDAVETITGEFPGSRHGIFRYWDVANPNDSGVRQEPNVISVLMDGAPMQYKMLWEDGDRFRVAKIGDPGSYLDYGTHVFEIRYTIPGVIDPGTTGEHKEFAGSTGDTGRQAPSVFYWNVIAPSWNNQIDHADITVTLPAPITGAQCSVGSGVGRACTDLTIGGDAGRTLTVSATAGQHPQIASARIVASSAFSLGHASPVRRLVNAARKPVSCATSCSSSVMRMRGIMASSRSASASASGVAIVRTGDIWRRPSRYRTPSRASRFRRWANFFSRQSSSRPRCSSHSPAVGGRPRADTIGFAFGSLSR